MVSFKILNSQISYYEGEIEIKEMIPNSEAYMRIYGNEVTHFSLDTPHYKITGRNLYMPSKEVNLADVKSFLYSIISNIIREDKRPSLSLSSDGVVYDFSVESHEVKVIEKTLNGLHVLSTVIQKPLLNSPMNLPLPAWASSFKLLSAVISLDERPKDVLKKHFQQITKIITDNGYIEKSGLRLTRFYYQENKKILCYTQLTGYVCFEESGNIRELRPSDKEVEGIINNILRGYGNCIVEKGTMLL
ncbi:hypothetical protein EWF20_08095 [Sulfolobus sp. S-194]|uniref:hypothetical protein n=1 Tax=Sulfolobus sp. S-194 TaxID=2512240 RepID=UPI0014372079|nr:hypothetical protein [Sulfolobus sp. S-194]QIW24108.1 hypothetical protein EWF20_08095 [Sulfolobus sp. S-194]